MKNEEIVKLAEAYLELESELTDLSQKEKVLREQLRQVDKQFWSLPYESEYVIEVGGEYVLLRTGNPDDQFAVRSLTPIDLIA